MNSKNSKTFDPHRLLLDPSDKINLTKAINMLLYQILEFTMQGKIDGSYSVSHIQDYFEQILEKHAEKTDNSLIKIYVNKMKNRITFKIKT